MQATCISHLLLIKTDLWGLGILRILANVPASEILRALSQPFAASLSPLLFNNFSEPSHHGTAQSERKCGPTILYMYLMQR
ncbi:hypothetical protein PMIN04_002211 [Paraphaeosphaeria minitans]